MKVLTAEDFVRVALEHMCERSVQYDKPEGERSIGKVVEMFNTLHGTNLTETQGWNFMVLLKMVRQFTGDTFNKSKIDSIEDQISYAALCGESHARKHNEKARPF